jgi:uncharacterized protein (DUF1501 family)
MKYHTQNSRRKFLKQAGLATFGLTTMSSSLFQLNSMKAALASNSLFADCDDYRALVCLFQPGGNDSFNMLLPYGVAEYNEYATTRSNLAIERDAIRAINANTSDGKSYGVNPAMEGVQNLFNDGKLSFLSNVGTMIQPVTKTAFENDQVPLPIGLFSHSDQIAHWESGRPGERATLGWGGRLAEMVQDCNTNSGISMNISMSGNNLFQAGNNILEFTLSPGDISFGIDGYQDDHSYNEMRTRLIDQILTQPYDDKFKKTYINVIKNSIETQKDFQESIEEGSPITTEFSNNSLSRSFETIAQIIAAREILGFKRQIFFIRYGGWDHHDDLLDRQNDQLSVVSNGLSEFSTALEELGVFDNVVTFTMSEFARTLTSNGNGSDHAWGGNVMVMGGKVDGGRLFGTFPSLEVGSELEIGRGRIIPTLSNDQYFGELALWLGVLPSDLSTIFPNIGNFYDTSSGQLPIGFLNT